MSSSVWSLVVVCLLARAAHALPPSDHTDQPHARAAPGAVAGTFTPSSDEALESEQFTASLRDPQALARMTVGSLQLRAKATAVRIASLEIELLRSGALNDEEAKNARRVVAQLSRELAQLHLILKTPPGSRDLGSASTTIALFYRDPISLVRALHSSNGEARDVLRLLEAHLAKLGEGVAEDDSFPVYWTVRRLAHKGSSELGATSGKTGAGTGFSRGEIDAIDRLFGIDPAARKVWLGQLSREDFDTFYDHASKSSAQPPPGFDPKVWGRNWETLRTALHEVRRSPTGSHTATSPTPQPAAVTAKELGLRRNEILASYSRLLAERDMLREGDPKRAMNDAARANLRAELKIIAQKLKSTIAAKPRTAFDLVELAGADPEAFLAHVASLTPSARADLVHELVDTRFATGHFHDSPDEAASFENATKVAIQLALRALPKGHKAQGFSESDLMTRRELADGARAAAARLACQSTTGTPMERFLMARAGLRADAEAYALNEHRFDVWRAAHPTDQPERGDWTLTGVPSILLPLDLASARKNDTPAMKGVFLTAIHDLSTEKLDRLQAFLDERAAHFREEAKTNHTFREVVGALESYAHLVRGAIAARTDENAFRPVVAALGRSFEEFRGAIPKAKARELSDYLFYLRQEATMLTQRGCSAELPALLKNARVTALVASLDVGEEDRKLGDMFWRLDDAGVESFISQTPLDAMPELLLRLERIRSSAEKKNGVRLAGDPDLQRPIEQTGIILANYVTKLMNDIGAAAKNPPNLARLEELRRAFSAAGILPLFLAISAGNAGGQHISADVVKAVGAVLTAHASEFNLLSRLMLEDRRVVLPYRAQDGSNWFYLPDEEGKLRVRSEVEYAKVYKEKVERFIHLVRQYDDNSDSLNGGWSRLWDGFTPHETPGREKEMRALYAEMMGIRAFLADFGAPPDEMKSVYENLGKMIKRDDMRTAAGTEAATINAITAGLFVATLPVSFAIAPGFSIPGTMARLAVPPLLGAGFGGTHNYFKQRAEIADNDAVKGDGRKEINWREFWGSVGQGAALGTALTLPYTRLVGQGLLRWSFADGTGSAAVHFSNGKTNEAVVDTASAVTSLFFLSQKSGGRGPGKNSGGADPNGDGGIAPLEATLPRAMPVREPSPFARPGSFRNTDPSPTKPSSVLAPWNRIPGEPSANSWAMQGLRRARQLVGAATGALSPKIAPLRLPPEIPGGLPHGGRLAPERVPGWDLNPTRFATTRPALRELRVPVQPKLPPSPVDVPPATGAKPTKPLVAGFWPSWPEEHEGHSGPMRIGDRVEAPSLTPDETRELRDRLKIAFPALEESELEDLVGKVAESLRRLKFHFPLFVDEHGFFHPAAEPMLTRLLEEAGVGAARIPRLLQALASPPAPVMVRNPRRAAPSFSDLPPEEQYLRGQITRDELLRHLKRAHGDKQGVVRYERALAIEARREELRKKGELSPAKYAATPAEIKRLVVKPAQQWSEAEAIKIGLAAKRAPLKEDDPVRFAGSGVDSPHEPLADYLGTSPGGVSDDFDTMSEEDVVAFMKRAHARTLAADPAMAAHHANPGWVRRPAADLNAILAKPHDRWSESDTATALAEAWWHVGDPESAPPGLFDSLQRLIGYERRSDLLADLRPKNEKEIRAAVKHAFEIQNGKRDPVSGLFYGLVLSVAPKGHNPLAGRTETFADLLSLPTGPSPKMFSVLSFSQPQTTRDERAIRFLAREILEHEGLQRGLSGIPADKRAAFAQTLAGMTWKARVPIAKKEWERRVLAVSSELRGSPLPFADKFAKALAEVVDPKAHTMLFANSTFRPDVQAQEDKNRMAMFALDLAADLHEETGAHFDEANALARHVAASLEFGPRNPLGRNATVATVEKAMRDAFAARGVEVPTNLGDLVELARATLQYHWGPHTRPDFDVKVLYGERRAHDKYQAGNEGLTRKHPVLSNTVIGGHDPALWNDGKTGEFTLTREVRLHGKVVATETVRYDLINSRPIGKLREVTFQMKILDANGNEHPSEKKTSTLIPVGTDYESLIRMAHRLVLEGNAHNIAADGRSSFFEPVEAGFGWVVIADRRGEIVSIFPSDKPLTVTAGSDE